MDTVRLSTASLDDAHEIFLLINEAYKVEIGSSGVGFKKDGVDRLLQPLEESIKVSYNDQRVIKAEIETSNGPSIVGVIVWDIIDILVDGTSSKSMYFGPFAVSCRSQGKGVGKLLMSEVDRIARANGISYVDINVVNHRSDLLPMYAKLGYDDIGTITEYPFPERLSRPAHFVNLRRKL
jgi:predicted N-acetyltransferase YhbS